MALFRIPKIVWNANTLEFGYPLDSAVSWEEPVTGSQWVIAPSGARDAWIVRSEPRLVGSVRWIPTDTIASTGYAPFTGWDGATGWRAFLAWVREMNTFAFYPDRDSGTNITSYLSLPLLGEPGMDRDGTRTLRLAIASSGSTTYDGY